jgi:hypothetical protein
MPIISTRGAGSARGFGFAGGAGSSCFVCATGGTITTCGDFKIHTFTGPGTFTVNKNIKVPANAVVDYLVVAGGGAAGGNNGGGGGAGGFRVSNQLGIPAPTMSPLANPTGIPVERIGYPITVGAGGAQTCATCDPIPASSNPGNNSIFSTITSAGGGAGANLVGHPNPNPGGTALTGGSGGGASFPFPPNPKTGAAGNTPPTSPPQGNNGGDGARNPPCNWGGSGGGGGASAIGASFPYTGQPGPNSRPASPGGDGSFVSPSFAVNSVGTTGPAPGVRYFAGGGAGMSATQFGSPGTGGAGGGGNGASNATPGGSAGTVNTGGGGGAGTGPSTGYAGGSGIVLIRYKFQ